MTIYHVVISKLYIYVILIQGSRAGHGFKAGLKSDLKFYNCFENMKGLEFGQSQ